jgi:hypothetical protein
VTHRVGDRQAGLPTVFWVGDLTDRTTVALKFRYMERPRPDSHRGGGEDATYEQKLYPSF